MTVRTVLVELVIPKLDGTYAPATLNGQPGEVWATPTARHDATTPAGLVLPSGQAAKLDDVGQVTLHLEHNDESWLWRIDERVNRGRTRFISIEDGPEETVLLYRELPDVDPGDGSPSEAVAPWWVALQEEEDAREAADALLTPLTDPRLTNSRPPNGGAGGVLSGSFPNPGFAVDMAEQTELAAETAARVSGDSTLATSISDLADDTDVAVAAEAVTRGNADTALGVRVDDEETAREAADAALLAADVVLTDAVADEETARELDIAAEAASRVAGDATQADYTDDTVAAEAAARIAADALKANLTALTWRPSDNNLLAANFPPRHAVTALAVGAGFYFANRVRIPAGTTITNVHLVISIAGAGLTYGAVAVYEADGTRSGLTGDQIAAWQAAAGPKSAALGTPIAAQGADRWVWVTFAAAGTTRPAFMAASSSTLPSNVGLSGALAGGYVAGAAPLPASMSMSMTTYLEFWAGIS